MTDRLPIVGSGITGLAQANKLATAGPDTTSNDWLDDDEISAAEKRRIEERIADFEKHLETSIPATVAAEESKRRRPRRAALQARG